MCKRNTSKLTKVVVSLFTLTCATLISLSFPFAFTPCDLSTLYDTNDLSFTFLYKDYRCGPVLGDEFTRCFVKTNRVKIWFWDPTHYCKCADGWDVLSFLAWAAVFVIVVGSLGLYWRREGCNSCAGGEQRRALLVNGDDDNSDYARMTV